MEPKIINSRQNKQYKYFLSIAKRKIAGLCLLEGQRLVHELLQSRYAANCSTVLLSKEQWSILTEEEKKTISNGRECVILEDSLLESLVNTVSSQGWAAVMQIPSQADLQSLLTHKTTFNFYPPVKNFQTAEIVLILDALQDPGNMGSIIRSAAAFGIKAIFTLPATVHAWQSKVIRAAMGGMFKVPLVEQIEAAQLFSLLQQHNYQILGTGFNNQSIYDYLQSKTAAVDLKLAVVIGNEGNGIREETQKYLDAVLTIPMLPNNESLNAAAACAVTLAALRFR